MSRIQDGVRPYADRTREFAERQPVLFVSLAWSSSFHADSQTFIAIFTALSIIPIATLM